MRAMILDYSQYETEATSTGIVNFISVGNEKPFFIHDKTCPFCSIPTKIVYEKQKKDYPEWLAGSFDQCEYVYQCPNCGWWEYKYKNQSDAILDGIRASDIRYSSAIIKRFSENSAEVPISALRIHLQKHPEAIYEIDAHKMEDLVRSVFSDYYPSCKVLSFGKTRDGGKDALLVDDNGDQFFIQIKRRSSPNATEGVGQLTAFIGATIINDNVKGRIFVSTADHYSRDAEKYARTVVQKQIVESFELIDCKRFLTMVDIARNKIPDYWRQLLQL